MHVCVCAYSCCNCVSVSVCVLVMHRYLIIDTDTSHKYLQRNYCVNMVDTDTLPELQESLAYDCQFSC